MADKKQTNIFLAVTFIYWMALYTYVPNLTPYALDPAGAIVATGTVTGIITGAYGFMQMLLRVPLGILSDRLNKRKIFVMLGLFLASVSALGMYLARSGITLAIFRGISGAAASSWVVFSVMFSGYFPPEASAKAIGRVTSANMAGQMVAMLLGGWISNTYGQGMAFMAAVILGGVGLVLALLLKENNAGSSPATLADVVSVGKDKNLLRVSALGIVIQLIAFGTVYGFTPEIATNLGATNAQLGILSTLAVVPGIFVAMLTGGKFIQKIGVYRFLGIAFVFTAIATAATFLARNMATLYVLQLLGGMGRGMVLPLLMSLCIETVPTRLRSTAMGFFQALYSVGMFIGPVVMGIIRDYVGLSAGFIILAAIALFSGAVCFFFFHRNKPNKA